MTIKAAAVAWITANGDRVVTTDYVMDEALTLLVSRGRRGRAVTCFPL